MVLGDLGSSRPSFSGISEGQFRTSTRFWTMFALRLRTDSLSARSLPARRSIQRSLPRVSFRRRGDPLASVAASRQSLRRLAFATAGPIGRA